MDNAVILDNSLTAYPDRGEIASNHHSGPDPGLLTDFYISDNIGGLADISGFGNLRFFTIKSLDHDIILL
jgi:hypothetical protein